MSFYGLCDGLKIGKTGGNSILKYQLIKFKQSLKIYFE